VSASLRLAFEIGPLLIFFAAYRLTDIYVATCVFMATSLAGITVSYLKTQRIPPGMLAVVAIVLIFGGLTLWLENATFIKMKPTVISGMFSLFLLVGILRGKAWIRPLMADVITLDERGWQILTIRWAVFFGALALLNELVWRNFSEEVWVNIKTFGYIPLTLLFGLAQWPLISRHGSLNSDTKATHEEAKSVSK